MRARAGRPAVAALIGCSALLVACGGDGGKPAEDRFLPGNPRIGAGGDLSGAAQADCEQWRAASFRQRQAAIEQLGTIASRGNRAGRPGAKLEPDEAYEILDRQCKQDFAARFRLYKLYNAALAIGKR